MADLQASPDVLLQANASPEPLQVEGTTPAPAAPVETKQEYITKSDLQAILDGQKRELDSAQRKVQAEGDRKAALLERKAKEQIAAMQKAAEEMIATYVPPDDVPRVRETMQNKLQAVEVQQQAYEQEMARRRAYAEDMLTKEGVPVNHEDINWALLQAPDPTLFEQNVRLVKKVLAAQVGNRPTLPPPAPKRAPDADEVLDVIQPGGGVGAPPGGSSAKGGAQMLAEMERAAAKRDTKRIAELYAQYTRELGIAS